MDRAILVNREVVTGATTEQWAEFFEKGDRIVAQDSFTYKGEEIKVSTVFLGLSHNFSGGSPLWFETMIFGGEHSEYQRRCRTSQEAEEMHKEALKLFNPYLINKPFKPNKFLTWLKELI